MNLVEATIDGDDVVFGQFRVPLAPGRQPAGGVAAAGSCSASGRRASRTTPSRRPSLPRIEADIEVLEELGSDAHVFFQRRRPADHGRDAGGERGGGDAARRARRRSSPPASTRARAPTSNETLRLAVDPERFHFFDPATRREPARAAAGTGIRTAARAGRDGGARVTKQSETRERVRDLIDQLDVGDAIPSERQLSQDLGVSRLTIRAALDELVREGPPRAPARLRHVRQRAEDRAGADDELLHRRHPRPRHDARAAARSSSASSRPAPVSAASCTSRRPSRSSSPSASGSPTASRWRSRRCTSASR